jgi:hypothetical protein
MLKMEKTQTKSYEIRRGRTEIDVPHKDSTITFVYEKQGPDNYVGVAESIDNSGLARPTMAETASLVYQAFLAKEEPEFLDIKDMMKHSWLWAFTGTLLVPKKGAYIQDDPEIRDETPFMRESELVKRLGSNDPNIRFVPFGFKTGKMPSLELAKNLYVIALVGEEGAEKLAKIADKHTDKPYLGGFESVNRPTKRVSALGSDWGLGGRRLFVVSGGFSYYRNNGYAFGIQKTDRASVPLENKIY